MWNVIYLYKIYHLFSYLDWTKTNFYGFQSNNEIELIRWLLQLKCMSHTLSYDLSRHEHMEMFLKSIILLKNKKKTQLNYVTYIHSVTWIHGNQHTFTQSIRNAIRINVLKFIHQKSHFMQNKKIHSNKSNSTPNHKDEKKIMLANRQKRNMNIIPFVLRHTRIQSIHTSYVCLRIESIVVCVCRHRRNFCCRCRCRHRHHRHLFMEYFLYIGSTQHVYIHTYTFQWLTFSLAQIVRLNAINLLRMFICSLCFSFSF